MMGLLGQAKSRSSRLGVSVGVLCVVLLGAGSAMAQQSMTVEELEAYIEKKKQALQDAIDQREATLKEKQTIEKQREEQQARQQQIEQELRDLCEEREATEPGSLQACLEELNIAAE